MAKNIVLIGFMGTGKSSVGIRLAQKLGREFLDMDREIETVAGMSIPEIFKRYGEVRFRSEEKLMAKKVGQMHDLVVSSGGGVVLNQENVDALKENGVLVCLDASPETIFARVTRKKGSRPLLNRNTGVGDIARMLKDREPFYACADLRINTSGKSLEAIIHEIILQLQQSKLI